jgi:hypothetical protein
MTSDELVIETEVVGARPDVPPPPPAQALGEDAKLIYAMSPGELFTREQYHQVGWSDDQLVQAGRMTIIAPPPEPILLHRPIGMPESKWVILDDNDDIPPTGLFVGHNGVGFLLQTGLPMAVPTYVLGVLDDAVMDFPVTDPKTRQVMSYRKRPRFTYREVPAPVEE